MKRRYRYMLNLFSLALLAFALYLNFLKKEAADDTVSKQKENSSMQSEATSKTSADHKAQTFVLK